MTKDVRTEDEANAELAEALAWYEERRPGLGGKFLAAVDRAIGFIADFSGAGSSIPGVSSDLPVRRFAVPGFPYQLIYLNLPEEIRVLAIAHDRREPGYWLERVPSQ